MHDAWGQRNRYDVSPGSYQRAAAVYVHKHHVWGSGIDPSQTTHVLDGGSEVKFAKQILFSGKANVVSMADKVITVNRKKPEGKAKERGRTMNAFLENLSQESRVIFLRRYWFCDSVAEIAQRYGMKESKVKMSLLTTRNQLAVFLTKEEIMV